MVRRRRVAKAREPQSLAECRERALRLLTVRPRSRRGLEQALRLRGFSADAVAAALASLEQSGLLDERRALEGFLDARRGLYGRERIRRELEHRGFGEGEVRRAVSAIPDEEELELLRHLCRRRSRELSSLAPDKRAKKVFDFLRRRGFPADRILSELRSGEDS